MTKESIAEYQKQYRLANKKRIAKYKKEYMKQWRLANKEHIAESNKQYRLKNKERLSDYIHQWYLNNKESAKAYSSEWAKNNRHKKNAYYSKYRATLKNQTPEMNVAELVEIEWLYMYNKIMPRDWDVDHIVALSNGGIHHPSNLQILSASDNRSKGNRL